MMKWMTYGVRGGKDKSFINTFQFATNGLVVWDIARAAIGPAEYEKMFIWLLTPVDTGTKLKIFQKGS